MFVGWASSPPLTVAGAVEVRAAVDRDLLAGHAQADFAQGIDRPAAAHHLAAEADLAAVKLVLRREPVANVDLHVALLKRIERAVDLQPIVEPG